MNENAPLGRKSTPVVEDGARWTGDSPLTKLRPMPPPHVKPKASIIEVALEAGVSRATAARALGGYGSVSSKAREKVDAAAAKLGYTANSLARSVKTGQTLTFGALIADVANPFFAKVIRGFSDGARAAGYDVMLVNTDETVTREVKGLRLLTEKRMDGILVAPASQDDYEHLARAVADGQAIVQVDRYVPGFAADRVVVDNYQASYDAVARVIAAGHVLIAAPTLVTAGPERKADLITTIGERYQGYRDAMRDAGLDVPPRLTPSGRGRDEVRNVMLELLSDEARPSAVFALDNSFMIGTIDAVHSLGLEVPREISVFGFDDTEWTTVVQPPLSVISQPAYDLGVEAARVLVRRIHEPSQPVQVQVLPTAWVERGSVGPLLQTAR